MPVEVRVAAVLCCLVLAGCPGGGGDDDGGVDEDGFGGEGGAGNAGSAGIGGAGAGGYAGAPMKSGGCTNTCSDANDGYCDDGGPNADYDFCKLGTDCADCGARGGSALDPMGQEPAAYSTLCFTVSSTAAGESLSLNCSDESVSCDDFGLQPTEYFYSSRAVCLQDAQQVLAHWQSTGSLGGASPDVDPSGAGGTGGTGGTGGSESGGSGGTSGSTCGGERSSLTVRSASGYWFERLSRPQQVCGVYSDPSYVGFYLGPTDERLFHVNGSDTLSYEYCYVEQVSSDMQTWLRQSTDCWESSALIVRGTFDPDEPGTDMVIELTPNGSNEPVEGEPGDGLNVGCQQPGEPCAQGSCCDGLLCFNDFCEVW